MKILGHHDIRHWTFVYVCKCGLMLEGDKSDIRHSKRGNPEFVCPTCNTHRVLTNDEVPQDILGEF